MWRDGAFHAAVWAITVVGIYLLLAARRRSARRTAAVTWRVHRPTAPRLGTVQPGRGHHRHHVLGIHHVRDLPEHVPAYDWAFLLVAGVGIVLLGWVLATQRTEAR
jgi:uncharacterized membrane protein